MCTVNTVMSSTYDTWLFIDDNAGFLHENADLD